MAKKLAASLAAAGFFGMMLGAALWHWAPSYLQNAAAGSRFHDRSVITAIVEDSIYNPEVQQLLHAQILLFLKSPEGKAKLAEMMKSPEMLKATADNLQSPEMRPALLQLVNDPAFRDMLINIMREAPEMRVLRALDSAIEWQEDGETDGRD
ncbi:MAG: hypothetical protein E6X17_12625 [Sporomusaceae bacterium]|nr:hypothetical protein [Sporomusaceae bacterium]